jgi:hypothetical protein
MRFFFNTHDKLRIDDELGREFAGPRTPSSSQNTSPRICAVSKPQSGLRLPSK